MHRLFYLFLSCFLGISSAEAIQTQDTSEIQKTYKDIKDHLGLIPTFLKEYPEQGITGAWMEMKGVEFNSLTALPGKYKELIGLAVAAQIPCPSCTYFHTEAAKINEASLVQIKEAVAMAAQTRRWSAFLNGVQIGMGEFRSEIDKMLMYQNKHKNLQAMEVEPRPGEIQINTVEDVYKDVRTQMGFVPDFITQYPKGALVGAWKELKGIGLNSESSLPRRYKELIGVAVSAQIPCDYCVYYHTQSAIMQGATKEELEETAALAGSVRSWSTVINGLMLDEKKFRAEVDQMMKFMKMKKARKVGLTI